MNDLIEKALGYKNWAVVGATQNTSKFGYKVFKKLKQHGYNVYPVNTEYDEVEGSKCFPSIEAIEADIDVVSMIVNPVRGLGILKKAEGKSIKQIWCQPGAESDELIEFAKTKGIEIIFNRCVLVELG